MGGRTLVIYVYCIIHGLRNFIFHDFERARSVKRLELLRRCVLILNCAKLLSYNRATVLVIFGISLVICILNLLDLITVTGASWYALRRFFLAVLWHVQRHLFAHFNFGQFHFWLIFT